MSPAVRRTPSTTAQKKSPAVRRGSRFSYRSASAVLLTLLAALTRTILLLLLQGVAELIKACWVIRHNMPFQNEESQS